MRRSFDPGRRAVTAAALLVLAVPLAACDPSGPTPPPSPSPQVSVSTGGTTSTPSPSESSSEDAKKAAYDRAVQASSTAIIEANRLVDEATMKKGNPLPSNLATYADPEGGYYAYQVAGLDLMRKQGWRYDRASKVAKIWADTSPSSFDGDHLSMYVCIDSRGVNLTDKSGKVIDQGRLLHGIFDFAVTGGQWRVDDYGKFKGEQKMVETKMCLESKG